SHVHVSAATDLGGFRTPPLTGEHLLRLMDGPFLVDGQPRRVDRAVLQPLISVPEGHDPLAHHRYVAEQVGKHPDRFCGCFVANPLLDTDLTLSCLRQLVSNAGFRMVKFHPTVHGYMPFRVVRADEAIYVARMNPNVVLETSGVDLPRVKEGVEALGAGRIAFGSDCPVQEMGSQLRTLEVLGWDPPIGIRLPAAQREQL